MRNSGAGPPRRGARDETRRGGGQPDQRSISASARGGWGMSDERRPALGYCHRRSDGPAGRRHRRNQNWTQRAENNQGAALVFDAGAISAFGGPRR